MNSMAYFGAILVPTGIVAALTFFLLAVFSQDSKSMSKSETLRHAFVYFVSFLSLTMVVSSFIYLGQEGLRIGVFKSAAASNVYVQPPPTLSLTNVTMFQPNGPVALTCANDCQLTASDRDSISVWKQNYHDWKTTEKGGLTMERKQGLVDAASFLIVGFILFAWFFLSSAQREYFKTKRLTTLRTAYFYLVAFIGLVALIISGTLLVNLGLKSALHLENNTPVIAPTALTTGNPDVATVRSLVNCSEKCSLSADDVAQAKSWLSDYEHWQSTNSYPRTSNVSTQLASLIPIFLVALPLFFGHYLTIRRESQHRDLDTPITSA